MGENTKTSPAFDKKSPKIEKLDKLNFYWGVQNTSFEQRLEQLKLFKQKYGHCRIPQKWEENPPLAS